MTKDTRMGEWIPVGQLPGTYRSIARPGSTHAYVAGTIDELRASLAAEGFAQIYGGSGSHFAKPLEGYIDQVMDGIGGLTDGEAIDGLKETVRSSGIGETVYRNTPAALRGAVMTLNPNGRVHVEVKMAADGRYVAFRHEDPKETGVAERFGRPLWEGDVAGLIKGGVDAALYHWAGVRSLEEVPGAVLGKVKEMVAGQLRPATEMAYA